MNVRRAIQSIFPLMLIAFSSPAETELAHATALKGDLPKFTLTDRLFPAPKDYFDKGVRTKALKYYAKAEPLKLLDYKIGDQTAHVHIPADYDEAQGKEWGLLLFLSPHDEGGDVLEVFKDALRKQKLIFAAPNNAGNERLVPLRVALLLDTFATMRKNLKFNSSRVYVGGLSGGATPAALAAILYPECFKGCLSFANGLAIENVKTGVKNQIIPSMIPYFTRQDFVDLAKRKLRFAFVTGEKDMNHKPILLTGATWKSSGLDFRIFDVPGLTHTLPPPNVFAPIFDDVLSWIDGKEVKGYEPRYEMYGIGSTVGPGRKKL